MANAGGAVARYNSYIEMCNLILDEVNKDSKLIDLDNSRLDDSCGRDDAHHMLVSDIIYFGANTSIKTVSDTTKTEIHSCTKEDKIYSPLNTILYGPPGTGKTYRTAIFAVAIIENKPLSEVEAEDYGDVIKRYRAYAAQGRVAFTTFHQSYGYEEFIEGIKPAIPSEGDSDDGAGNIQYQVEPGIFKKFCDKAVVQEAAAEGSSWGFNGNPNIWKVSLEGTGDNPTRTECLERGHIRIGWDGYGKEITDETNFFDGGERVLNTFISRMNIGDVVLSCYSAAEIDAIGVVTGEYEWHDEYPKYKRLRKVDWIVKGIREDIVQANGGRSMTLSSVYRMQNMEFSDIGKIIEKHRPSPKKKVADSRRGNYVFIIDEINRGNISKIFGELITLIEPSRRLGNAEETTTILPYSQKSFGVPANVYIVGTMNTADRSIAQIDTALRRRFCFREIMPDSSTLDGVYVEGLPIGGMLTRMNERISVLYDREHMIGHAYFMPLRENPTIETLARIFEDNIIPLLQEYFFDDYKKIRLVLGDNQKSDPAEQFVVERETDYDTLFGGDADSGEEYSYEINNAAFRNIEAYRSI